MTTKLVYAGNELFQIYILGLVFKTIFDYFIPGFAVINSNIFKK